MRAKSMVRCNGSFRFTFLLLVIFIVNGIYVQQSWMSLKQKKNDVIAKRVAEHREHTQLDSVVMAAPSPNAAIDVDVVISVISPASNSAQRENIRKSWQYSLENNKKLRIKVLFFVPKTSDGADIQPEYDDEIVLDFQGKKSGSVPPYDGRAFLKIYDWIQRNCLFKILLRADESLFIRTDPLVDSLEQVNAHPNCTRMVWGSIRILQPLNTTKFIDLQLLDQFFSTLPPHPVPELFGLGYNVVALLVQHYRQEFLQYASVEEISLGMWLFGSAVQWRNDDKLRIVASKCSKETLAVIPTDWTAALRNTEQCGDPCTSSC